VYLQPLLPLRAPDAPRYRRPAVKDIDAGNGAPGGGSALLKILISFAVGGLLGDVFLHMLPHSVVKMAAKQSHDHVGDALNLGLPILTGMLRKSHLNASRCKTLLRWPEGADRDPQWSCIAGGDILSASQGGDILLCRLLTWDHPPL
jgi:hypothetical protein